MQSVVDIPANLKLYYHAYEGAGLYRII